MIEFETTFSVQWTDGHGKCTCDGFDSWLAASEYALGLPEGCTDVLVVSINKSYRLPEEKP